MDINIFDIYADLYGNVETYFYDYYFINFIRKTKKQEPDLLDVGGGSGTFAKLVKDTFLDINVTIVDPSNELAVDFWSFFICYFRCWRDDVFVKVGCCAPFRCLVG